MDTLAHQIGGPCPTSMRSGSIDDFLADYQHESSSIIAFMNCLEEPKALEAKPVKDTTENSTLLRKLNTFSNALRKKHTFFSLPADSGKAKPTLVTGSRTRSREIEHQLPNSVEMAQSDEVERRRIRNREYQRRFREKRIQHELECLAIARAVDKPQATSRLQTMAQKSCRSTKL